MIPSSNSPGLGQPGHGFCLAVACASAAFTVGGACAIGADLSGHGATGIPACRCDGCQPDPHSVHGTAFATLTLANNLLGLAPGPFLTGRVSDLIGLHAAFQLVPLVSLAAAAVFFYAKCHYQKDIARLEGQSVPEPFSAAGIEVKL